MSGEDLLENEPGDKKGRAGPRRPTICAECAHYSGPSKLCGNPTFASPPQYDFVTGRRLNEIRPKCVDTNKRGDCPGFEEWWLRRYVAYFNGSTNLVLMVMVGVIVLVAAIASLIGYRL